MLENWKDEAPRDRIIVALDCDRARALDLADMLSGHAAWLKIGMTLFYKLGPQIVYELKERGLGKKGGSDTRGAASRSSST